VKNLSLILNGVLLIAIIPLYVKVFSGAPASDDTQKTMSKAEGSSAKIAYVHRDSLITYYKFYEDAIADLNQKREKVRKQLETRGGKLEMEVRNIQQRAQAGLMSNNEIRAAEEQLMKKQQDLAEYQQTVSTGLAAEEQTVNEELFENINAFLDDYKQEHNYKLIINYVPGGAFWMADDALDITEDVIEGLNKEYEVKKEANTAEGEEEE